MSQGATESPKAIKGFNDVRPGGDVAHLDARLWQQMLARAHETFSAYGFAPVWLPLLEETALFARGIGDDTDVVSKEMYSFEDRGGRSLTLRPEGTAGAARAYIEHQLARNEPIQRWYYAGPMFRAERPQKGRYRQFYQIGAELFGAAGPAADVEMVLLVQRLLESLGITAWQLKINTLGDADSRAAYVTTLRAFLLSHRDALCEMCQRRAETNPLRVLDCKRESCQAVLKEAPDGLDALTPASRAWFDEYQKLLEAQGVPFVRDRNLVRGLDYYSDAIFEVTGTSLGAQDALLGGGRYDRLISSLGGAATPAVGFAAGLERLALAAATLSPTAGAEVFVALQEPRLIAHALGLGEAMRNKGCRVEVDTSGRKLKQALKRADRAGCYALVVLGEREVEQGQAQLRRLADGASVSVALSADAIVQALTTWRANATP